MDDNKITIENLTNQPKSFVLPHQHVCVKLGRCICSKNGTPASLHLFANKRAETFQVAINAPDLKKALHRKQVRIVPTGKKTVESSKPESDGSKQQSKSRTRRNSR